MIENVDWSNRLKRQKIIHKIIDKFHQLEFLHTKKGQTHCAYPYLFLM